MLIERERGGLRVRSTRRRWLGVVDQNKGSVVETEGRRWKCSGMKKKKVDSHYMILIQYCSSLMRQCHFVSILYQCYKWCNTLSHWEIKEMYIIVQCYLKEIIDISMEDNEHKGSGFLMQFQFSLSLSFSLFVPLFLSLVLRDWLFQISQLCNGFITVVSEMSVTSKNNWFYSSQDSQWWYGVYC